MITIYGYKQNPFSTDSSVVDSHELVSFSASQVYNGQISYPTTYIAKIAVYKNSIGYVVDNFINLLLPNDWRTRDMTFFHGDIAKFIVSNL